MIPEAHLVDADGVTGQESYAINKRILKIGRSSDNNPDILIDRDTVSSSHAEIEYRGRKFYLKDLGSRNGTYVNDNTDRVVEETALEDGDIIMFDQYKFGFQMPGQGRRIRVPLDQKPAVAPPKPAVSANKTILSVKKSPVDDRSSKTVLRPEVSNSSSQENQTVLRPGKQDSSGTSQPPSSPVSVSGNRPDADEEALDIPGASLTDTGDVTGRQAYSINRILTLIGRQRESVDICLDKGTVSGEHAQIEYRDNAFYLSDLGSSNGTYVSDSRDRLTSEVALNDGEIIYFDQYRFKFVMNGKES